MDERDLAKIVEAPLVYLYFQCASLIPRQAQLKSLFSFRQKVRQQRGLAKFLSIPLYGSAFRLAGDRDTPSLCRHNRGLRFVQEKIYSNHRGQRANQKKPDRRQQYPQKDRRSLRLVVLGIREGGTLPGRR